jgi:hypothetical protein
LLQIHNPFAFTAQGPKITGMLQEDLAVLRELNKKEEATSHTKE